ncbi:MAG TPA: magnesium transporter [Alphaproteobacteria bacterium]|jgi:magnesium transporter
MADPTAEFRDVRESLYGLTPDVVDAVREALDQQDVERVRRLVKPLHYTDVADLLERLSPDQRERAVDAIRADMSPEVLTELDEAVRQEVIDQLGIREVAAAVTEMDTDDAVEVIEYLDEDVQQQVLEALPAEERALVEEALAYPEGSAGRLMQREFVAVPAYWTVGETIDHMRLARNLPDDFYDIFVVNPKHEPIGKLPLSRVLRSRRPIRVSDIMRTNHTLIPVTMDQEEIAQLFRRLDLVSAAVVDEAGRLVGTITIDDVVDVIDEEAEEDMLSLARVGETDIHVSAIATAPRRVRWLIVTLINSLIASVVISQFEPTIEKLVSLAVLMPIVAAMGGNAGMQVVTVMVRALATREVTAGNALRVVGKELAVGAMNGIVLAAIMGTIAALWFNNVELGVVLAAAMLFNMIWSGIAGTTIPLALNKLGIDPAVAAGPFLTTTTDVLGFFVFLGLATLFLI